MSPTPLSQKEKPSSGAILIEWYKISLAQIRCFAPFHVFVFSLLSNRRFSLHFFRSFFPCSIKVFFFYRRRRLLFTWSFWKFIIYISIFTQIFIILKSLTFNIIQRRDEEKKIRRVLLLLLYLLWWRLKMMSYIFLILFSQNVLLS